MSAKPATFPNSAVALGALMVLAGGAAAAIGYGNTKYFHGSFLFGAMFWATLAFGMFALTLMFHLFRPSWGKPIQRIAEAGGGPVSLAVAFGLLAVCVFVFPNDLYKMWMKPDMGDSLTVWKLSYLNYPFFVGRFVLYAASFIGISLLFKNWLRLEEKTGEKKWSDKRANLAGFSVVWFFLVITFLVTDLVMSIDTHWYSTIWGAWFAVGGALTAVSLCLMILATQQGKEPFAEEVSKDQIKDLGNLLLMFTMLWAYFSFSQLLIIWYGNLKEFIPFYLSRLRGNLGALGMATMIGQFVIPFLILLWPNVKRNIAVLGAVAGMAFFMRAADMYWIIAPYFKIGLVPDLADLGCFLFCGGVWSIAFGLSARTAPLIVDPNPYLQKEVLEHV